uniref:BAR domain-containing protein n=1 Tax=Tetradesmus obliquus TaxID=3088 RepID=A0A383VT62_TETOB
MDENRTRLGFGRDRAFVPTPNVRNPNMLVEAEAFSHHLGNFEDAVRTYHRRVQGFVRGLLPLLDSNLPRVWLSVDEASGLAEPLRPSISHGHPSRVGGDFDTESLHRHLDRLDRGIQEEVLLPLRRWQEGLAVAKERMRSLDRLRKEVDGQRRKAEKKFSRSEAKLRKAYLGAGYGTSSSDDDDDDIVPRGRLLEDYHRLALHTERQLRALLESYEDQERLVWEQLSGLVTDAAWLESYAAATMLKVKEAFQGVAMALGASKQPLPAYRAGAYAHAAASTSVGRYGDIGEHTGLIAQMSPRAVELARGGAPRATSVLPYTPLRAKKGLATPLLVAAAAPHGHAQRALAREDVPELEVGASGLPLHALPASVRHRALREVEAAMSVPGTVPSAATAGSSSRMTTTTGTTSALAPPSTTRGITHPTAAAATSPMSTAAAHTAPMTPSGAAARPRSATAATASPTAYGTESATSSAIREPSLKLAEPAGNAGGSFPASSGGLQGEAVRDAAAVGRGSGSTAPFGHLAGEERYDERYNASSAGEGFGAKTAVGSDNVLDSFASPVKAAGAGGLAGTGLAGTGTVAGAGAGDVGVAAESAHMGTGGHSINGVGAAAATGGHGMATAALHEADLAAADEPALAASTSPTAAADTADNTAALEAELAMPRAAATTSSSSSHYEAARPTTPGGSSITDAIRAEISRGSTPRHSMSFEPAAAAATSPAYAPAAFNATHTGTAHMAGGASPLAGGGTGEEEEFVDARSTAPSSRTSSMSYEPHGTEHRSTAAGAPWSPVSNVAGLSKQQQQQQVHDARWQWRFGRSGSGSSSSSSSWRAACTDSCSDAAAVRCLGRFGSGSSSSSSSSSSSRWEVCRAWSKGLAASAPEGWRQLLLPQQQQPLMGYMQEQQQQVDGLTGLCNEAAAAKEAWQWWRRHQQQ